MRGTGVSQYKGHFCQTPDYVFSLGVDFVLPLSQQEQEQEQEQEPPPKSMKRGFTRSLKFDT